MNETSPGWAGPAGQPGWPMVAGGPGRRGSLHYGPQETEPARNSRVSKTQMWGLQIMAHSQPLGGQGRVPRPPTPPASATGSLSSAPYTESYNGKMSCC